MAIPRDVMMHVGLLIRPLATRAANMVARAVVQLVNDDTKMQLVQLGVLQGEDIDNAEHFQSYGFSSVPLAGAEAVVLFPNGDRAHPLVVTVADRRYKPTGRDPGDVTMHHYQGAKVTMFAGGDVEIQPGPGGTVFIRDAGGIVDRLVKKSEHDGHTHGPGTYSNGGGAVAGLSGGAAAVTGTDKLRVQ